MISCSVIAHNHPVDPISHVPIQVRVVCLSTGRSPIPKWIRIWSVSMVATLSCAPIELEQTVQAQHAVRSENKLEHMMLSFDKSLNLPNPYELKHQASLHSTTFDSKMYWKSWHDRCINLRATSHLVNREASCMLHCNTQACLLLLTENCNCKRIDHTVHSQEMWCNHITKLGK
jgi:hypothetical protein